MFFLEVPLLDFGRLSDVLPDFYRRERHWPYRCHPPPPSSQSLSDYWRGMWDRLCTRPKMTMGANLVLDGVGKGGLLLVVSLCK